MGACRGAWGSRPRRCSRRRGVVVGGAGGSKASTFCLVSEGQMWGSTRAGIDVALCCSPQAPFVLVSLSSFCPLSFSVFLNYLLGIGKGARNAERRAFQDRIITRYRDVDKPRVMREIGDLDPLGQGSYERGCVKLLKWYRTRFWGWDMSHLSDDATAW